MNFKDHFSGHATHYRVARPVYPGEFLDALCALAPTRTCCWDVGCGNGQASVLLADRFERVVATDPSANQIAEAEPRPNIDYRVEPAEASSVAAQSVSFISVAQAYHWFDHERFVVEAKRVAATGAVIAAYGYRHTSVNPAIDELVGTLYATTLASDWPPERRHVDAGLLDLPFPFDPLSIPQHELRVDWTVSQFLDYLRSWSASQRYVKRTGIDAVDAIAHTLTGLWGIEPRSVRFDLFARVGRVR